MRTRQNLTFKNANIATLENTSVLALHATTYMAGTDQFA